MTTTYCHPSKAFSFGQGGFKLVKKQGRSLDVFLKENEHDNLIYAFDYKAKVT